MATEEQQLAASLGLGPIGGHTPAPTAPPPPETRGSDIVGQLYGGRELEESTRDLMESRFGERFADVRIHTGHRAAETADALHSRAFTVGEDIVFAEGEFAPETTEGQRLLAHELAHVVQQRRTDGIVAGDRETERDAHDAAHEVDAGGTPRVRERAEPGTVQKQEATSKPTVTTTPAQIVGEGAFFAVIVESRTVATGSTQIGDQPTDDGGVWDKGASVLTIRVNTEYYANISQSGSASRAARDLNLAMIIIHRVFNGDIRQTVTITAAKPEEKPKPPKPQPQPQPQSQKPAPQPQPDGPEPQPGKAAADKDTNDEGKPKFTPGQQAEFDRKLDAVRERLNKNDNYHLGPLVNEMNRDEMAAIPASDRERILRALAGGVLPRAEEEQAARRLLETTPSADARTMIQALGSGDAALLIQLNSLTHGEEYILMHRALRRVFMDSLSPNELEAQRRMAPEVSGRNVEVGQDGMIKISHQHLTLNPFQMVRAGSLDKDGPTDERDDLYMPAFNLLLENQVQRAQWIASDWKKTPTPWMSLSMLAGTPMVPGSTRVSSAVASLDDAKLTAEIYQVQSSLGAQKDPTTGNFTELMDRLAELEHEAVRRGMRLDQMSHQGVQFGTSATPFPFAPILTPQGSMVRDYWHGTSGHTLSYGDYWRMSGMGVGTLSTGEAVSPTRAVSIPWGVLGPRERGLEAEAGVLDAFFPGVPHLPRGFPGIDFVAGGTVTPWSGVTTFDGNRRAPFSGFQIEGGTGINLKTLGLRGFEGATGEELFGHMRGNIGQIATPDFPIARNEAAPGGGVYRVEVANIADERVMFIYTDRPPTAEQWRGIDMLSKEAATAFVGPSFNRPVRVVLHYSAPTVAGPSTMIDMKGNPAPFRIPAPYMPHMYEPPPNPLAGAEARMAQAEGGTMGALYLANEGLNKIGSYVQEREAKRALYDQLETINDWRIQHPGEGVEAWFTYWQTISHPDSMITPGRQFMGIELKTGERPTGRPPDELFPGNVTVEHERRWFPPISEKEKKDIADLSKPIPIRSWQELYVVAGGKGATAVLEQLRKSGDKGEITLPNKVKVSFAPSQRDQLVAAYETVQIQAVTKSYASLNARYTSMRGEFDKLSGEWWGKQWWENRTFELKPRDIEPARGQLELAERAIQEKRWDDAAFNLQQARKNMELAWQKMEAYQGRDTDE
jgi:hypothetical protein